MTRNQQSPKLPSNLSGSVMFSVDPGGNITPTAAQGTQSIQRGDTLVTQAVTVNNSTFSGHICARQSDVCKCSTLVDNVSSGNHMVVGTGYSIKQSVADGEFEIYAVSGEGPIPGATNGDIQVGG